MRPVFCAVCFQFFFMKSAYEQTVWMSIHAPTCSNQRPLEDPADDRC